MSGAWVEGRSDSEIEYTADSNALLEDSETEHWFYNKGNVSATAYVCDVVPDNS